MGSLRQHPSTQVAKILLIGDSGAGKTGALASLANAGFKLRIQDYDNGLDALRNFVKDEFLDNVEYLTLTDKMKQVSGKIIPDGPPKAFANGMALLNHWKYTDSSTGEVVDLGRPIEWGDDTFLVIDSLTFMGDAIMRYLKVLNGKQMDTNWEWYGPSMERQEGFLEMLYSDAIKCNVVVTAHVTHIGDESAGGALKGYPSALGKKLPPKVPRYFNTVLKAETSGYGQGQRRIIRTRSTPLLELKNPAPDRVPVELPLETGMADFMRLIRAKGGQDAPKPPTLEKGNLK